MSQANGSDAGDRRTPPLAQELDAVQVRYTWKFGEAGKPPATSAPDTEPAAAQDELIALRAQVQHFTAALEDIVTLALSSADYKERAIMMHRRAVAALSGPPRPSAAGALTGKGSSERGLQRRDAPASSPDQETRPMAEGNAQGGSTHANRDRTDLAGSPQRPAEETGEKGSGRSSANPPSEKRETREKPE